MSTRRGFLAGILAAGVAPALCKAGVLMPVRELIVPRYVFRSSIWSADDITLCWQYHAPENGIVQPELNLFMRSADGEWQRSTVDQLSWDQAQAVTRLDRPW